MIKRSMPIGTLLAHTIICTGLAFAGNATAQNTKMATVDMLVNTCIACHGAQGISNGPAIPSLAGLTRNYLIGAMLAYKFHNDTAALEKTIEGGGEAYEDIVAFPRYSTIMGRIAAGYTVAEIEVMADYFAQQQPRAARQKADSSMADTGKKLHKAKCEKCHEDGGHSPIDDVGILAGQWMPYLRYTLQDYQDGKREMPKKMKTKMKELHKEHGAEGIEQLIQYYGRAK